jgi:hypothetical protein
MGVARLFRLVQPKAELSLEVGHLLQESFGAQGVLMPLGEGQFLRQVGLLVPE